MFFSLFLGNTEHLCTAGFGAVSLWDCETGTKLSLLSTGSSITKTCGFSMSGNLVMACRKPAQSKGEKSKLIIFDIRDGSQMREKPLQALNVDLSHSDPSDECSVAVWCGLDKQIVLATERGEMQMWDLRSALSRPEPVVRKKGHDGTIKDLQVSRDQTMVISSSSDCTAKLWDAFQLEQFKVYKSDRPLNSAAIAPNKPHVSQKKKQNLDGVLLILFFIFK